ncbi:MAG: hypothetical protein WCP06_10095 [Verrucomicrobiota bacterium]
MQTTKLTAITAAIAATLLFNTSRGWTQDAPPPQPSAAPAAEVKSGPGAPSGDRMKQFRQRMAERLKTALKASDEEWSVIQPLLEKMYAKQREVGGARFGFGGRRGGGGPGGEERGNRPSMFGGTPQADALEIALKSESTSPAEIKAKLDALREARKKATAQLDQAREDLRKVLTQRQEATLVLIGILQ